MQRRCIYKYCYNADFVIFTIQEWVILISCCWNICDKFKTFLNKEVHTILEICLVNNMGNVKYFNKRTSTIVTKLTTFYLNEKLGFKQHLG